METVRDYKSRMLETNLESKNSILNYIFYLLITLVIFVITACALIAKKGMENDFQSSISSQKIDNKNLNSKIEHENAKIQTKINNLEKEIQTFQKDFKLKNDLDSTKQTSNESDGNKVYDFKITDVSKVPDFEKLVGLTEAKNLAKPFINFTKNQESFKDRGDFSPNSGMMMYGTPGCGKTVLARAIAKEAGLPLIEAGCDIFARGYVGEAPKMVRELFEKANEITQKNKKGAIIFLDECESVFLRISELKPGSEIANVVNAFKVCLVPLEKPKYPIFIIGATNNINQIDEPILSRFPIRLELKPGDFKDREAQLKFIVEKEKKLLINPEAKNHLLTVINKALDFLRGESNDYKKAYRVLTNFIDTANGKSITREIEFNDFKKNKEIILNNKKNELKNINQKINNPQYDTLNSEIQKLQKEFDNLKCSHPNHEKLYKNNLTIKENDSKGIKRDPILSSSVCVCKGISIEDLENTYLSSIDESGESLRQAKEFFNF